MNTEVAKKPPNARGQGRKSLSGGGKSPVMQVRMTPEQKTKVDSLGGPDWVRKAIDSATDSQATESPDKGSQVVDKAVNQALDKIEKALSKAIENARGKA
jgi:hypothetical protein